MIQVTKSQIDALGFDFVAEVDAFREKLLEHRFTENEPAPLAPHPLVAQAVRREPREGDSDNFVADYEIIDDIAINAQREAMERAAAEAALTPEQRRERKRMELRVAETKASANVIKPGKVRLLQVDFDKAMAKPDAKRSRYDREVMNAKAAVAKRLSEIQEESARAESDLDDVADDQIDAFKVPTFERA